jgi:hypothetical protein
LIIKKLWLKFFILSISFVFIASMIQHDVFLGGKGKNLILPLFQVFPKEVHVHVEPFNLYKFIQIKKHKYTAV